MGIRYISPTVAGFFASVSWGADDMWDASVEYLGDVSDFKVQARFGYGQSKDSSDAPSIECMATNIANAPTDAEAESSFFAFEGGIEREWFDIGPTTLFGQFYRMGGGANARLTVSAGDAINSIGAEGGISSSTVKMWSAGITQDITSVDTKLYLFYRRYIADVVLAGASQIQASEPLEDLQILMGGALIEF